MRMTQKVEEDSSKMISTPAFGAGYVNFNYKELTTSGTEDSAILTDISGNPVTAKAVILYSTVACQFGVDRSITDYDNEPQLPAETFFSIAHQVSKVYGKSALAGTLRIYYVW